MLKTRQLAILQTTPSPYFVATQPEKKEIFCRITVLFAFIPSRDSKINLQLSDS